MSQRMAQGQPMIVMSDESQRVKDKDAQEYNISAARAVAEAVRSTLGPKGMDKMLVDSMGDVTITNDGVTILKEMDIDNPTAEMIVEVAETQEDEAGDGTTTAVAVAGELLKNAQDLLEQDIHPTAIIKGFHLASQQAREEVDDIAEDVEPDDEALLRKVAETSMTGKGAELDKEHLGQLIVDAVSQVAVTAEDETLVDMDFLKIETQTGRSASESDLLNGAVIDKDPVSDEMPKSVEDADVLLLNEAIEVEEASVDTEVNVTDPSQLQQFIEQEEQQLKEKVDQIVDSGADVVFCQKGIDDMAQHYLAKEGILAVRRTSSDDAKRIARSTGARVVSNLSDIEADDLGFAGNVVEQDVAGDTKILIEDVEDAKSVTMLLRGGTEHVVDEVERAIDDSLGVVRTTLEEGKVLPGGGAPETALSLALRDFADSVGGREQLAIEAFADAAEVIPRTLAENAGLDSIDSLVELRSKHDAGDTSAGLDAYTGDVIDMSEEGVVEPLRVKTQAIESATEAAVMLLRIDDVIAAGDLTGGQIDPDDGGDGGGPPAGGPGGMGGGMGGMGGMGGAM